MDTTNIRNNIKINFLGKLEKEKVMNFYLTNHVDLFLNTSISEGIPVSIMEAISFGIPILATNVGGTKEIVNNTTGFLIDAEFKPENIAEIIDNRLNGLLTTEKKNPKVIADLVEEYIQNPSLISKYGLAAREKYENNYTIDKFERNMLEMLTTVNKSI